MSRNGNYLLITRIIQSRINLNIIEFILLFQFLGVILGVNINLNINMKISNASKESIARFTIGGEGDLWKARSGSQLVKLFQTLGFRDDTYDPENGGLPKLKNSKLNTSKFSYVKDRICNITDINLRKLIERLIAESSDKQEAIKLLNEVLAMDSIQLKYNDNIIAWEGVEIDQEIENEVAFKENESKVINAINNAKVSILVAMSWFTNENIKEALDKKRLDGLRIEIVIFKDGVNHIHGVDLSEFDSIEIRSSRGGIMHNKFCVIDNQKVLTGSYNWTTNAEYKNDENVLITIDNDIATKYSIEFRRLKPLI